MKHVTIKETCMVKPAAELHPTPPCPRRLWLSNLDLLHPESHSRTIYHFHNKNKNDDFFDTKRMKDALSKTLALYYPMAGRLAIDGNGRMEVECNGEGVMFRVAEAEGTEMSELGQLVPPSTEIELTRFVPSVDYSKGVSSYPLMVIQVTKFKCGGVCLGIGNHHAIVDGESGLSFIKTWSELCGGSSFPTIKTPFLDRTIFRSRQQPKFHHTEYDPQPTLIRTETTDPRYERRFKKKIAVAMVKITPDQLRTLKENHVPVERRCSTYEILTAHIWRCVTKARGLDDEQVTKLQISVDGRYRLNNPPVPQGYFGNVIFHATPTALAGDLVSEPMIETIERIQTAIKRMDDEYLRSAIDYLEDEGGGIIRVRGHYRLPNLKLVSWTRLPLKNADFGWGQPSSIRQVDFVEGTGILMPVLGDGSLPLTIGLEEDAMEEFERMFYGY